MKEFLSKYNAQLYLDKEELKFNSLIDILEHIKNTGVNAIAETRLTKTQLTNLEENYKNKFSTDSSLTLTYEPVYVIVQKNDIE